MAEHYIITEFIPIMNKQCPDILQTYYLTGILPKTLYNPWGYYFGYLPNLSHTAINLTSCSFLLVAARFNLDCTLKVNNKFEITYLNLLRELQKKRGGRRLGMQKYNL